MGLYNTENTIATSPHDVELMRVFCSAKNAYQILQCKIGVTAHIKVDICLFCVAILWLFRGYFVDMFACDVTVELMWLWIQNDARMLRQLCTIDVGIM